MRFKGDVEIGKTLYVGSATADAGAVADFDSITKALLIPRMTTTQRNAIPSPKAGMLIYNTTTSAYNAYIGSWVDYFQTAGGRLTGDLEIYKAAPVLKLTTSATGKSMKVVRIEPLGILRVINEVVQGGIDAYTVLNLHLDETGSPPVFLDSSPVPKTVVTTNCVSGTGPSGFAACADFAAAGSKLTIPFSSDFDWGTGDFEIDFRFRRPASAWFSAYYRSQDANNQDEIFFRTNVPGFVWRCMRGGAQLYYLCCVASLTDNQWYHFALVRSSGVVKMYLDGAALAVNNEQGNPAADWGALTSGSTVVGLGSYGFVGMMDEFRVSKGTPRWTGAFTPRPTPYDAASTEIIVFDSRFSGTDVGQNTYGGTASKTIVEGSNLQFNVGGVAKAALSSAGKFGLGTAAPAETLDVVGTARLGDSATNYSSFGSNGDHRFAGTAGLYPRVLNQAAIPAAGTGATQLDAGEMCVWTDSDDSNKPYICYNVGGTVKSVLLT